MTNSGETDEIGNLLFVNSDANGRFHTDWLNMIYPRLKVSKDLLAQDGIIVLTIDDCEIETVTMIMNEVFGSENHLATVVIKNNPSGRSTVKGFSINHEYALLYSKSDSATLGRMKHSDEQVSRYKEKDNTGFGVYLNHEGVKFGYGLGGGIHVDDDGFHFGGLKL
jgi:adenine-specific DNA-methyltransferase